MMAAGSASHGAWPPASLYAALEAEVHVRHLAIAGVSIAQCARYRGLMSAEEEARLKRFHVVESYVEYLVAHGALREWMGRYLETDAASLVLPVDAHGKPQLAVPTPASLSFNLSHSNGHILLAFARDRRIGVDIERHDARALDTTIYPFFFTPTEQRALRALPASLRMRGFFSAWTRKEAFIKATGEGLSANLQSFHVSVDPRQPATFTLNHPDDTVWHLHALDLCPDYEAAVVVSGDAEYQLRVFTDGCA
jgi:4'-phosphopantetheinyl transferase